MVSHMIDKAQQAQKHVYNRWKNNTPVLHPGDLVWLETTHLLTDRPSPKLDWKQIGPVKVKECLGPVMYKIQLPPSYKIHDMFHVSLLTPVRPDTVSGRQHDEPAPIMVCQQGEGVAQETEEHFIMERYANLRWVERNGKWTFQYRVKWDSTDEMTWEDCDRLNDDMAKMNNQYLCPGDNDFDMEQEFYDQHPDAPRHDDPVGEWVNTLGM